MPPSFPPPVLEVRDPCSCFFCVKGQNLRDCDMQGAWGCWRTSTPRPLLITPTRGKKQLLLSSGLWELKERGALCCHIFQEKPEFQVIL